MIFARYGLAGVIVEAEIDVVLNRMVWLETMQLNSATFPSVYRGVLNSPTVAMKVFFFCFNDCFFVLF